MCYDTRGHLIYKNNAWPPFSYTYSNNTRLSEIFGYIDPTITSTRHFRSYLQQLV